MICGDFVKAGSNGRRLVLQGKPPQTALVGGLPTCRLGTDSSILRVGNAAAGGRCPTELRKESDAAKRTGPRKELLSLSLGGRF